MKLRSLVAAMICLPLVGSAWLFAADDQPADPDKPSLELRLNEAIAARASSARQAYDAERASWEAGTSSLNDLIYAANQLVGAEVAGASTEVQKLSALEKHVAVLAALRERIKGGEANHYHTISREVENARVMLITARIAAK